MLRKIKNVKIVVENPAFEMEEITNEVAERKRRVNNVLIFNVNESSIAKKSNRSKEEINTVKDIHTHAEKYLGNFNEM